MCYNYLFQFNIICYILKVKMPNVYIIKKLSMMYFSNQNVYLNIGYVAPYFIYIFVTRVHDYE